MTLSIIILTWNSERYVSRCLSSLFSSLSGSGIMYEVIVVDNGSNDNTCSLLQQLAAANPGKMLIEQMHKNCGTTVPRNLALNKARGTYLCIMDSDVEVSAGIFQKLIEVLKQDVTIGLVTPKIFYPSGNWQKSYDRFPTLMHKLNRFVRLRSMEQNEAAQTPANEGVRNVDYAISAFWLFPRKLLKAVGMLDENIFYSPEDVDYCLRIWRAGKRIVYVPAVSVVHHTQEISRGLKLNRAKISHLKGLIYLFHKHRYFFRPPTFAIGCEK